MKIQAIKWKLNKITYSSWSRGNLSKPILFHIAQSSNHWHSAEELKPHMSSVIATVGKAPRKQPTQNWVYSRFNLDMNLCWGSDTLLYHTAGWQDWALKFHVVGTQTICLYAKAWCCEAKIIGTVNEKKKNSLKSQWLWVIIYCNT